MRDPDDRVVAGVCAAFARATGTDPVLWRVAVAVLALFGGAGVALYLLGWVLIPQRGADRSPAERLLRRPDGRLRPFGIVLLVLAGALLLATLDNGPGIAALLVIAAVGFLAWRERRPVPGARSGSTGGGWPAAAAPSSGWGAGTPTAGVGVALAPTPPQPASPLGLLTVAAAALTAGLLSALDAAGVPGLGGLQVLAATLLVVGAGLVVGAWWGRARWLAAPALGLALLMGLVAAADGTDGAGERTWLATDQGSYSLTLGEAVLDLSALEPGDRVSARLGVGALTVLVPEDLPVAVDASVGLGELRRVSLDGGRVELLGDDPADRRVRFLVGDDAGEPVRLDLRVRLGEIEVRRVPS